MAPEIQFFIGKGGVGKSTISALTAVSLAQKGNRTVLASMDPAHNLGDIFEIPFSNKPRRVLKHLSVLEVDMDLWVKKWMQQTEATVKRHYSYESAFNLSKHFNVLQFSPGLEEYALLLAFENILQSLQNKHTIIFDMAPTALTLRFFSLPSVTLIWLNSLLRIREEIYDKKEIISNIKIGEKKLEKDTVKSKLESMIETYKRLKSLIVSNGSKVKLVINEDSLSFAEAFRTKNRLDKIGIRIDQLIINKISKQQVPEEIGSFFTNQKILLLPVSFDNLVGVPALKKYINKNIINH